MSQKHKNTTFIFSFHSLLPQAYHPYVYVHVCICQNTSYSDSRWKRWLWFIYS